MSAKEIDALRLHSQTIDTLRLSMLHETLSACMYHCGAWYPAYVTTLHSEGGEVEVLWDGEFTRCLLPVSNVRHFS